MLTSHHRLVDTAEVAIEPSREREESSFRPTVLMGKIAALLADKGELSQRMILAAVKGKTDNKRDALLLLILDGYVSDKTPHKLSKPYEPDTK